MPRFQLSSFRLSLIFLVLLAILPALVLVLISNLDQRHNTGLQVQQDTFHVARLITVEQEQMFVNAHQLLTTLTETPEIQYADEPACSWLLVMVRNHFPQYASLGVLDTNGDVICSSVQLQQPLNLADRDYFQEALQNKAFSVSGYQIGRISHQPVIVTAAPLLDKSGRTRLVLTAALDLKWIQQLASEARLPDGAAFSLVDRDGMIFAHYPVREAETLERLKNPTLLAAIQNQEQGTVETVDADGVHRLYAFLPFTSPFLNNPVYLVLGIPSSVAYTQANQSLLRNLSALGVVLLLALAAAWFGGNSLFVNRIQQLLQATQRLAEGDLSVRSGLHYGSSEISQLAVAFDRLAAASQAQKLETEHSLQALSESEERFRRLAENAQDVIYRYQLRPTLGFDYISPAIASLTGYQPEDFYRRPNLLEEIIYPDDWPNLIKLDSPDFPFNQPVLLRWIRKDGRVIWTELHNVGIFDEQQHLLAVEGTVRDTSERKRTQQILERRLSELETMHAVAMAETEALGVDDLLTQATYIIAARLYPHNFGILLLNEATAQLEPHPSYRAHHPAKPPAPLDGNDSVIAAAIQEGRPVRISDLEAYPEFSMFRETSARALVCAPLFGEHGPVGVLYSESEQSGCYNEADEHLLVTFADELAAALEKQRLHQAEVRRNKEIAALSMISAAMRAAPSRAAMLPVILEQVVDLFQAEGAMLALANPESGDLVIELAAGQWAMVTGRHIPAGQGLQGRIFSSGAPFQTDHLGQEMGVYHLEIAQHLRTFVGLPLLANEHAIGVVSLGAAGPSTRRKCACSAPSPTWPRTPSTATGSFSRPNSTTRC